MKKELKIFVLVFALSGLLNQCSKPDNGLADGRVLLVNGTVNRNGQPLSVDAAVKQGDKIETADDSSAEIIFEKGLIIRLGSNTKASLDLQESRVKLDKGWFAAVKNAGHQKLEVVTPAAMASVRGTSMCIRAESEEATYACTCNGTVHYHAPGLSEESVTAAEHSAVRFVKKENSVRKEPAGLEYHSNADIEDLAKKIDHPLDWSKP